MLHHNDVDLSQLSIEGKNYKWKRPICPKCSGKVWGHGFATAFFSGHESIFYLKKYRCPSRGCRAVITMRPSQFWKKFQTDIDCIFNALSQRLESRTWPPWVTRQRGGHWLRKFIKKVKMNYGLDNQGVGLGERLRQFYEKSLHFFN